MPSVPARRNDPRWPASPDWTDDDIVALMVSKTGRKVNDTLSVMAASPDTWVSISEIFEATGLTMGEVRSRIGLVTMWKNENTSTTPRSTNWFFDGEFSESDKRAEYRLSAARAKVINDALTLPVKPPHAKRDRTSR